MYATFYMPLDSRFTLISNHLALIATAKRMKCSLLLIRTWTFVGVKYVYGTCSGVDSEFQYRLFL